MASGPTWFDPWYISIGFLCCQFESIQGGSSWFETIPMDSSWFKLSPVDLRWFKLIQVDST